jgi:hypothetical protein
MRVTLTCLAIALGVAAAGCERAGTSSTEGWSRDRFQPGGGDAFLFYVVYGGWRGDTVAVSTTWYRAHRLPSDIHAWIVDAKEDACAGFLAGPFEDLLREQPTLEQAVRSAPRCIVFRGDVRDPASLAYLRNTIGVVTATLDAGGVAVLDPQAATWWSPSDWRARVFGPTTFTTAAHMVFISTDEADGQGEWLHSRGLRKLGRPDLGAHHVRAAERTAVVALIQRLAAREAQGEVIADGAQVAPGMIARRAGSVDDVEFNNVHLELVRAR